MPLYDVSDYEKNQWRYQRRTNDAHAHVVNAGERRYKGFERFSEEVFHKFITPTPRPVEHPDPGQEIFQRLHSAMDAVPEVQDLRERCLHDEDTSAQATNAIIQELLSKTDALSEQVPSSEDDLEALRAMESFLKRREEANAPQETIDKIREEIERLSMQAAEHAHRAKQIAEDMDDTNIRAAIRAGAKAANEAIDAEATAFDAFPGDLSHSGKRARRTASASISGVLKNNARLAEIIKLAGRLRRIALDEQRSKPRRGVDEYCGIERGADLERLVPSEWATADDPDLDVLFYRAINERSLAQFEITARQKEQQGPIVFLLDSSGSMRYNQADAWAAAVCIAFMQVAILQKRSFAIVHFGSGVLRTDVFPKGEAVDHAKIADAVSFFASDGGTNFMDTIDEASKIIEQEGFKKADIVMCTDGQAYVSDEWLGRFMEQKKERDFSLYSILVGPEASSSVNERFSDETVHLRDMLDGDDAMHSFFRKV